MGYSLGAALAMAAAFTGPDSANDILDINGYFKPTALHDPFLALGLLAYVAVLVGGLILLSRKRRP